MYPSISVCSRRHGDEYRNESDLSLFQRSVNLSTTIHYITLYQKDDMGHKQLIIRPTDQDMENRDEIVDDNMPKAYSKSLRCFCHDPLHIVAALK